MKLNPNAQKWVDALRSGNYKQGKNHLRNSDGTFCCLGVLCEIAIENGVKIERTVYGYDDYATFLPPLVVAWSGMKTDDGSLEDVQREEDEIIKESLAVANDDGYAFAQIADIIEKYADVLGVEEKNGI